MKFYPKKLQHPKDVSTWATAGEIAYYTTGLASSLLGVVSSTLLITHPNSEHAVAYLVALNIALLGMLGVSIKALGNQLQQLKLEQQQTEVIYHA